MNVFSRRLSGISACCVCLAALLFAPGAQAQTVLTNLVIEGELEPVALAVNPVTHEIYVANNGSANVTVIDAATDAPIAMVNVGSSPDAIAVDPITDKIYVANAGSANVTVIDGATNTATATVAVGANPGAIAVDAITNQIYVANKGSANVTVIDGAGNSVAATVAAGTDPYAIAVNPVTDTVYVANYGSANVTVIDGAGNSVVTTVAAGTDPNAIAINPVTDQIYVCNYGSATVTLIDGATNAPTNVTVGGIPNAIAVNPATNEIYVAVVSQTADTGVIAVIDGATNLVTPITLPAAAGAAGNIAVDPVTNQIYVVCFASHSVTVIDGASNTANPTLLPVGELPIAIAVDPVNDQIYVTDQPSGVTVIAGATNATTSAPVGTEPEATAVNPVTDTLYVANFGSASVTAIDEATGVSVTVPVGANPDAIAVNPVTNTVYVTSPNSGTVTVIDGISNSAIATLPVGMGPDAIAINPATNQIYVANLGSNTVSVIDGVGNGVTATVPVGTTPLAIAANPVTNQIYVGNFGSANVSVIDGATNVVAATVTTGFVTAIAVNPMTDTVYVGNQDGNMDVIDGATNAITATVTAQGNAIAVDPATDTVYVSDYATDSVTVVDGANNTIVNTLPIAGAPQALALNSVNGQIYVLNSVAGSDSDSITVIDGASNGTSTVATNLAPAPSNVATLAVNPVTDQVYASSYAADSVTVLTPSATAAIPLTVAIAPVTDSQTLATTPVFRTTNTTPSFTLTATSSYTGSSAYNGVGGAGNPPPTAVYYQLDTWEGNWIPATMTSAAGANPGSFSVTLPTQALGTHILYAYAVYGDEGTPESNNFGTGNSPEIGNIQSLTFNVEPLSSTTALTTDAALNNGVYTVTFGSPISFTANVTAAITGVGVNTGTVSFYDGTSLLGTVSVGSGATFQTSSLAVGNHSISAQYMPEGAPQYLDSFSNTLTVNVGNVATATTTVLQAPRSAVYGQSATLTAMATSGGNPVTTGTVSFYSGSTLLGAKALNTSGVATLAATALPAGTDVLTASYGATTNYAASTSTPTSVIVAKAMLAITAANVTVPFNQAIPALTGYTATGFLDGDTSTVLSGTPAETTTAKQGSSAGAYPVTIAQGSLAAANYAFTFVSGTLTISGGQSQTIIFAALPNTTYGAPAIMLTATASSSLPVSYAVTGPARVSGSTLSITGAGTVTVTASQAGNSNFAVAASVSRSFTVGKASLMITAANVTVLFNQAIPALTGYTVTGFLGGDTSTVLSGAPAETTTATKGSPAGSYPISITQGTLTAANYAFTSVNGMLIVTQATPSIAWAAPSSIPSGTALSATQLDATTNVAGMFVYSPPAGTVLNVGTQALSVTFTPTDAKDYTSATAAVSIMVTAAAKTNPAITWSTPTPITYGTRLTRTQLDARANVAGRFAYAPSAGTLLTAGRHTLSVIFTPTNTTAYNTVTASVTLVVNQATPRVLWLPIPISYGRPLGRLQLDALTIVPGTFTYTPPAGTVLGAGKHELSAVFTPKDSIDFKTITAHATLEVFKASRIR